MPALLAEGLHRNGDKVITRWRERVREEIRATEEYEPPGDTLAEPLSEILCVLARTIRPSDAPAVEQHEEARVVAGKHGRERASISGYTIDQVIAEYHVLRQVIGEVLDTQRPPSPPAREMLVRSIEQMVQGAATAFTDTVRAEQEQHLAAIAHDMRSPLMTVRTGAQVILKRTGDAALCLGAARRIMISERELEVMVDGLLSRSQAKSGQHESVQFDTCALDALVREVSEELNFTYGNRFVSDLAPNVVGYWDAQALRRVLGNLAINAMKHGERDVPITITLRQSHALATLSVQNAGRPIPRAMLAHLLDPRPSQRPSRKGAGWGLGLAVVKRLVEAHHGRIKVSSSEGEGPTVLVELPIDPRH